MLDPQAKRPKRGAALIADIVEPARSGKDMTGLSR
jgi:hypothetical protein